MRKIFFILFAILFNLPQLSQSQITERGNKAFGIFSATTTIVDDSDSLLYTYTITSADSSKQVLNSFRISIKDPSYYKENKSVSGPETKKWHIDPRSRGYITGAAAGGRVNFPPENGLAPGESITISFPSGGLPSIMPYYTRGFVDPITMTEFDSLRRAGYTEQEIFIEYEEEAYKGITIAPKVWGEEIDAPSFLNRLFSYLTRSCTELGWSKNQGLCRSLEAKLENTEKQLGRRNTNAASGALQAFLNEVEAQKDKQLSPEAYALLYYNGQYLIERL